MTEVAFDPRTTERRLGASPVDGLFGLGLAKVAAPVRSE